jgi:hypothetical protein
VEEGPWRNSHGLSVSHDDPLDELHEQLMSLRGRARPDHVSRPRELSQRLEVAPLHRRRLQRSEAALDVLSLRQVLPLAEVAPAVEVADPG